jgi:hypothetical protein
MMSWLKLNVTLQPTVNRSVCFGVGLSAGALDHIFLPDNCGFLDVRHPHWRVDGSVIYCCCWDSPAQSFSGLSRWTQDSISLSQFFVTPRTWRARSPIFISPRNRVTRSYPRALGSLFVASYDSQGYLWWRYSNPPPILEPISSTYKCEASPLQPTRTVMLQTSRQILTVWGRRQWDRRDIQNGWERREIWPENPNGKRY